jgi:two-component system cell cycle sensor histidine kinase/response regulator CckA
VFSPLQTFRSFLAAGFVITLFCTIFLTYIISRSVTRPLEELTQKLGTVSPGDFSVRMDYEAPDELGKLSTHFNSFMDRLEGYHGKLNNEIKKNKNTQAALVENELKLRELFNQSFQYIGILSPHGILEEVNQSALDFAGCTQEEALYKPLWETLWWRHDLKSRNGIKTAVQRAGKGELIRLEITIMDGKGEPRDIDVSIKPVFNNSGQIEFLITEARDITDLKHAEQEKCHLAVQLEKSQKMEAIGTLAGGIAHDFNNILSSIFGYSQLAEMSINTPKKATRHIGQIVKGAQRAAGLVQQILTFSRQTEYKKHPLKIHLVVKEAMKLIRSSIPTTIDIKIEIQSRSMVMADHTQMHQVIMNLCTNAYHSMLKTGGVLTVRLQDIDKETLAKGIHGTEKHLIKLQPSCNYLRLEVIDTGHGMDQKTLKKAFDPYFTTKDVGRGTGFGLALVNAIIEEHEGVIHAQSEPGIGSSFFIYLPVVEKEFPLQNIEKTLVEPMGGEETIMVVDDEKAIRMLILELLESFGYTVHSFKNGEEALTAFKQDPKRFDLIITDMTMPRMAGDEFAREVLLISSQMQIILCTGYSENISKTRAMEIGIKRYIQKPIQNQNLLTIIRDVLDTQ